MELKDLLTKLNISDFEIFYAGYNTTILVKIENATLELIQEKGGKSKVGLVLHPDPQTEDKYRMLSNDLISKEFKF